jgi:predicted transcriptional regulator
MAGIDSWNNLKLNTKDVELTNTTLFYDDFTGTNGDPPNPGKWDTTTSGGLLEIENNELRAHSGTSDGTWYTEVFQTKNSFAMNHTISWRQRLHVISGNDGMYYNFYMLNGDNGSKILGTNQNNIGEYQILNFLTYYSVPLGYDVWGWHDYKVNFIDGYIEFYYDGVKSYEYDYGVTSVKYVFGNHQLNDIGSIFTDDILMKEYSKSGNIKSSEIVLAEGKTWESLMINKTELTGNTIKVSILDGVTSQPISGFENLMDSNIDITGIDYKAHPTIRLQAHFSGDGSITPLLHDWKVTWRDTIPPETPTGLNVNNPWTGNSLILNWNSNMASDITCFALYIGNDNVTFYFVEYIDGNNLSFTYNGLSQGTTYYYKISAIDEVPNESPFSNVAFGVPDLDFDNDNIGNLVDPDIDGDSILNLVDAFPENPNEWMDTDYDGTGNNADLDDDGDGYADDQDDFPLNRLEWSDFDGDGVGDNTDNDIDNDGISNAEDAFPLDPAEWIDTDSDGIGNNADLDDDGDGFGDFTDDFPLNSLEWNDLDNDGTGDNSDDDIDGEGVMNVGDAFPHNPYEWLDTDSDGIGNNADLDDDGDGYYDLSDDFPFDPLEWNDLDNDGIGDNSDDDIDGEGIMNVGDAFPNNPYEWLDTDSDGIGNNADLDDDGDGYYDLSDDFSLDPSEWNDLDNDGTGDNSDDDIDGEGIMNVGDAFPHNPYEWLDTDSDGIGNNADLDDDGDGYHDLSDDFPLDPWEWNDLDDDGVGNNADLDDDGDGFTDIVEFIEGTDPLNKLSFPQNEESGEQQALLGGDKTIGAAIGVAAGVATTGLILSSEFLWYALLLIFTPLLVKLKKKELLNNEVRDMVRTYIKLHPGVHYSAIKSGLGMPNGSLIYHLNKMEKKRTIYSKRDGRFKRFYPKGTTPEKRPILTEFQEDLLKTISETPGISKAELSYLFERNRQDINHNVNVLKGKGLLDVSKDNGNVYLFIKDGNIDDEEKTGYKKTLRVNKPHKKDSNLIKEGGDDFEDWTPSVIGKDEKKKLPPPPPPQPHSINKVKNEKKNEDQNKERGGG